MKASFYDPDINRTYGALAARYDVGVLPARLRKPREKTKADAGVPFAQSYILGRLRRQDLLLACRMQEGDRGDGHGDERPADAAAGGSRRELFEKIERATLVSLPDCDCECAEWRARGSVAIIAWRSRASSTRLRTQLFTPKSICESPRE